MPAKEQALLRVYLRSTDKAGWTPAADALISQAMELGFSGGTVFKGIAGFDERGTLADASWWFLVERRPVVVEMIDALDVVERLLPRLESLAPHGAATLQRVNVLLHPRLAGAWAVSSADATASTSHSVIEGLSTMNYGEVGLLLRIFVDESDLWENAPLYRVIVNKAQELGLGGAAVFRGGMGFGAHSRVHADRLVDASNDLPILIEIVDVVEKVESLLPFLQTAVAEGLVTTESVRMLRFDRPVGSVP